MTKPFIVVADGFDTNLFQELKQFKEFEVHPESKLTPEGLETLLPRTSALVIRSSTTVNPNLLEKAPNLKYVIRAGEGTDNIDKASCQSKGVKVSNTPGANNNSAAEHAIALMFTLLRNTSRADQSTKSGKWEKSKFMGLEMSHKKIGIIGLGRIGQIVAKRLQGFEPEVSFFDPSVSQFEGAKKVEDLKDIFKNCDIISIHVPLIESTRNLINKYLLNLMKKDSILVNASRGGVVNEEDLYQILLDKKIRGAALDVFAQEPLESDSKLNQLDNILLTPHLGASTEEAQKRVGEMVLNQLKEFFINNNLLNEVRI